MLFQRENIWCCVFLACPMSPGGGNKFTFFKAWLNLSIRVCSPYPIRLTADALSDAMLLWNKLVVVLDEVNQNPTSLPMTKCQHCLAACSTNFIILVHQQYSGFWGWLNEKKNPDFSFGPIDTLNTYFVWTETDELCGHETKCSDPLAYL